MEQIIQSFLNFVQQNPLIVLGIMSIAAIILVVDREFTLLCPKDEAAMRHLKDGSYQCPKCGFVKGGK